MKPQPPRPAPGMAGFSPYAAAGRARREGILLDANENAWGPAVPDPTPFDLHRYPDATYAPLREAAAAFVEVSPDSVAVGNGSDELLDLVFRVYADPGDAVAVATPTYGMVRTLAGLNRLEVREVPLPPPRFGLEPEAFLAAAEGARIAVLCSPNNPTGNLFDPALMDAVIEGFDGLVVLDEAYVEFADDDPNGASLVQRVATHPNLCVLRTMSKAWGLAGIRVGYAVAAPEVAAMLERARPPYTLDAMAAAVAIHAFAGTVHLAHRTASIRDERERLAARLRGLGLDPLPSAGNFLLVPTPGAAEIVARLRVEWGVRIRDRSGLPGLPDAFRVTVGRPTDNALFLAALAAVLGREVDGGTGSRAQPLARRAATRRITRETMIAVAVELEGSSAVEVATGIAFFDHMLEALRRHAGVGAVVAARGDVEVDLHHTVEDVGLALGEAIDRALGDRSGIGRYGFLLPMDESLAQVALDLSGRPLFVFDGTFSAAAVGGLPATLVPEFFRALCARLRATLHLSLVRGGDPHHEMEACFKAVGRALGGAVRRDPGAPGVPSTKGTL